MEKDRGSEFEIGEKNQVRRVSRRASYSRAEVYSILDRALVGQVGFVSGNGPFIIPMLFARDGDRLLLHGSTKSRLMLAIISGQDLCFSVTHLDGLVLAKSLFHHSMNYRSATCFGVGSEIKDPGQRMDGLRIISEKVMPGRWNDARKPLDKEMKATCVAAITIQSASAKIRTGGPIDEPEDHSLPVWAGVVPLTTTVGEPVPGEHSQSSEPDYMNHCRHAFNQSASSDE